MSQCRYCLGWLDDWSWDNCLRLKLPWFQVKSNHHDTLLSILWAESQRRYIPHWDVPWHGRREQETTSSWCSLSWWRTEDTFKETTWGYSFRDKIQSYLRHSGWQWIRHKGWQGNFYSWLFQGNEERDRTVFDGCDLQNASNVGVSPPRDSSTVRVRPKDEDSTCVVGVTTGPYLGCAIRHTKHSKSATDCLSELVL